MINNKESYYEGIKDSYTPSIQFFNNMQLWKFALVGGRWAPHRHASEQSALMKIYILTGHGNEYPYLRDDYQQVPRTVVLSCP
jgi:hypothetical protein